MNRRTIRLLIFLGIFFIASILVIQIVWIRKTVAIQEINIQIQEREDSLNLVQFTEHVHLALRNVLEDISDNKSDQPDLYGAVNQLNTYSYSVDINEELHPFYLETLLKREFYKQNIRQDFQYGIYDCFNDSIVFGNLIKYTEDSSYIIVTDTIPSQTYANLKWKNDGHYFTVIFPGMENIELASVQNNLYPWLYLSSIVILVLLFFAFTFNIILKQKRLSEVKNDFINNMTHELKTPIATIGLSSETLLKSDFSNDQERLKRYAAIIYKENKRLENQVERVLNIAKLDKEHLVLKKELIDIHELIIEAKESHDLNQLEHEEKITLSLEASDFKLNIDPVHMTNVIYNLLDNALKYCDKNPEINIKTYNDKKGLVIEFSDNGIGIKKEDLKLIFDKFYRVSTGNLHDVKGFGLGLYYVKLVVEAHEGKIDLKSTLGIGSTFSIHLPI